MLEMFLKNNINEGKHSLRQQKKATGDNKVHTLIMAIGS